MANAEVCEALAEGVREALAEGVRVTDVNEVRDVYVGDDITNIDGHLLPDVSYDYRRTHEHYNDMPFMIYPEEVAKRYNNTYRNKTSHYWFTSYGRVFNIDTGRFVKTVMNTTVQAVMKRLFTAAEINNKYYEHNMAKRPNTYYQQHREERLAYQRAYTEAHRDEINLRRMTKYYRNKQHDSE